MKTPQAPPLAGVTPLGFRLDWSAARILPDPKGRDGLIAVQFPDRPAEELRAVLKSCRFGWSPTARVWIGRLDRLPPALAAGAVDALEDAAPPDSIVGEFERNLAAEDWKEGEV